jgi:single-stranded-DNA-specific exonuclease
MRFCPLVALGTVADVVKLDANNRRLVAQGLKRIRAGHAAGHGGAVQGAAGARRVATTFDFGFALGPRINAAGRLADMTLGIECLLTDDAAPRRRAGAHAGRHQPRAPRDRGRHARAGLLMAESLFRGATAKSRRRPSACSTPTSTKAWSASSPRASRTSCTAPPFVFAASSAPGKEHELKGSGRSIPGFHLRDALDLVAKRHPGVLLRFGGHAMAAGCTMAEEAFDTSSRPWPRWRSEWLDAATLTRRIETDGPLAPEYRRADLVDTLHREVWGQGFAPPVFSEEVQVLSQRLVGEKHLSLKLKHQGQPVDGIWFGHTEPLPARCCWPSGWT